MSLMTRHNREISLVTLSLVFGTLTLTPAEAAYNPELGRFMQADPNGTWLVLTPGLRNHGSNPTVAVSMAYELQYGEGMNFYEYLRSNPPYRHDPSGLYSFPDLLNAAAMRAYIWGSTFASAHPLAIRFAVGLLAGINLYGFAKYQEVQAIIVAQPNPGGIIMADLAAIRLAMGEVLATSGSITALRTASTQTTARVSSPALRSTSGIRFAQKGVTLKFQKDGPFEGKTYHEVADMLRHNEIQPSALPIEYVNHNGARYSVNTRSLMALRLAGKEPTITQDVTKVPGKLDEVLSRLDEIGFDPGPGWVP